VLLDTAAQTIVDAPRPSPCLRGLGELDCIDFAEPFLCQGPFAPVASPDVRLRWRLLEGDRGVARGKGGPDAAPMLVGFSPRFGPVATVGLQSSPVLWQRPLASGGALTATESLLTEDIALCAGRAVTGYEAASGKTQLVAVDAQTGKTQWEVTTPSFSHFMLSATRVYVGRTWNRIDVRDAATGRLLGGAGKAHDGP
jgi:hypothetical protein